MAVTATRPRSDRVERAERKARAERQTPATAGKWSIDESHGAAQIGVRFCRANGIELTELARAVSTERLIREAVEFLTRSECERLFKIEKETKALQVQLAEATALAEESRKSITSAASAGDSEGMRQASAALKRSTEQAEELRTMLAALRAPLNTERANVRRALDQFAGRRLNEQVAELAQHRRAALAKIAERSADDLETVAKSEIAVELLTNQDERVVIRNRLASMVGTPMRPPKDDLIEQG